jgi:hypothetical protein
MSNFKEPSRVHLEKLVVAHLFKKFFAPLETESSLPCSRQQTTGPYHGPKGPVHICYTNLVCGSKDSGEDIYRMIHHEAIL